MFSIKLKELREGRGLSQQALAQKIEVSQSTIGMWESKKREPNFETMEKIADFFNVTTDYLLGREVDGDKLYPSADITYMEVIGSVKAGYDGTVYEEHTGEVEPIPTILFKGHNKSDFFLLRVSDNSMYPRMLDGDLVLVKRENSVDSGAVAVILYRDDTATIKTVKYINGQSWLDLIPANPEYETKHIEGAELERCRILGRVVKLIRAM